MIEGGGGEFFLLSLQIFLSRGSERKGKERLIVDAIQLYRFNDETGS